MSEPQLVKLSFLKDWFQWNRMIKVELITSSLFLQSDSPWEITRGYKGQGNWQGGWLTSNFSSLFQYIIKQTSDENRHFFHWRVLLLLTARREYLIYSNWFPKIISRSAKERLFEKKTLITEILDSTYHYLGNSMVDVYWILNLRWTLKIRQQVYYKIW